MASQDGYFTAQIHQICEEDAEVFGGSADEDPSIVESRIENVRLAQQYIQRISSATLDDGTLDEDIIHRLRHPIEGEVDISDPDTHLSLDIFFACSHASEETYNSICNAIKWRFPSTDILSQYQTKKLIETISGVVSVVNDMCIN